MKAKLLTAVAVVAALSASLWLLSSTRERGPKAPAVSRAESRNETTETGTMAPRRRRAPEARAEAPRVQQERQEADARDKEDTGDRERRAARHGTEPDPREVGHRLDGYLSHEPKDATWSRDAEAAIASAFHGETFPGARLLRADCHATLCRVEVGHESGIARDQFMERVADVPPFNATAGFVYITGEGDEARSVLYTSRQGHNLPPREAL